MAKNTVSLREYVERIFIEKDRAYLALVENQRQALDRASADLSKRLDGMNEFRESLKDQASHFVSGDVLEARLGNLDTRIEQVRNTGETARAANKVTQDDRLDQLNKRLAAHDLAIQATVGTQTFENQVDRLQSQLDDLKLTRGQTQGQTEANDRAAASARWLVNAGLTIIGLTAGVGLSLLIRLVNNP